MPTKTPESKATLSESQHAVMVAIAEYVRKYKVPPTYTEIAQRLGVTRNAASQSVAILRRKGMLSSSPGRFRYLAITRIGHIAAKRQLSPRREVA
jgi:Mn-dependent DtxR family transcriptional regulator